MGKRKCQNCGEEFEGRGRALFCPKPECQAARRERHLRQMREGWDRYKKKKQLEPKARKCLNCGELFTSRAGAPLFCSKPECQKAREERRKAQKRRRRQSGMSAGKLQQRFENWIPAKIGTCVKCEKKHCRINRWGLCLGCYAKVNIGPCGGDWIYTDTIDEADEAFLAGIGFSDCGFLGKEERR